MIRKLLLPAVCAALLGGCVTAGYGYSDGGYYYGRPSVQYYGGAGYGYGYPYGAYYGGYGYPSRYYGYGGYYGGYGYPYAYYPRSYYPRGHYRGDGHHHGDRDHDDGRDHDGDHDDPQGDRDDPKPPWRRWADNDGELLRRRQEPQPDAIRRLPTPGPRQGIVERAPAPRMEAPRSSERRTMPERAERTPRVRQERDLRREQEP